MKTTLNYLSDLESNNNREWFKSNDILYKEVRSEFENFVSKLIIEINKFDPEIGFPNAKSCIFRINRDVRFSSNKDPYKNNFGAYINKGGRKSGFAGYYFHLQPNSSFAGGGIFSPSSNVLKKIRTEIYESPEEFKSIINQKEFKSTFGDIYGKKLKTRPKGFDDFKDVDLIRHQHYAVLHGFDDNELDKSNFINTLIEIYKTQKPFNNFLNNSLTIE